MKRFVWIFIALVLVGGGLAWWLKVRSLRVDAVTYTWLKPVRRDLVQKVTANGSITPILST